MSRYGIPYRGSKSRFADEIIDLLPEGKVLIDMFAGGCAVTHAALAQMGTIVPKWQKVIANDIDKRPVEMFQKAVLGGFKNEKRWISREDFFRLKDTDYYVKRSWSFGNDGKSYLYGKHIEPWKKAMWYARVFGDWSMFEEIIGVTVPTEGRQNLRQWVSQNNDVCKERYIAWYGDNVSAVEMSHLQSLERLERLQSLQSLERLERLQSLESLERLERLERLEISNLSYELLPPRTALLFTAIFPMRELMRTMLNRLTTRNFTIGLMKRARIIRSTYQAIRLKTLDLLRYGERKQRRLLELQAMG